MVGRHGLCSDLGDATLSARFDMTSTSARRADRSTGAQPLTGTTHWDGYWEQVSELPIEVVKGEQSGSTAILDVLDRFVAASRRLSVLEIGGAPGGYIAYLWRRFGHDVCVMDSSGTGVALTRENFRLLGLPGEVVERDVFSEEPPVPQFDVVYSLGLIEHFEDTESIVRAHLAYLRPGGRLIIGCPNLRGVNEALLRWLSPSALSWHHLQVMDIRTWTSFERALQLDRRFAEYVAGFQPGAFWRCERRGIAFRALSRALVTLGRHWNGRVGRAVARRNSGHWSYYAIGVYDRPVDECTTKPPFLER
jgi:SAM-dependent methyltransferase